MDDLRERLEAALQLVHDLAQGKRSWTLSVPARPDYDPDLVLSSTLRDALDHPERLSAPSATAATENEALRVVLDLCMEAIPDCRAYGDLPGFVADLRGQLAEAQAHIEMLDANKYRIDEAVAKVYNATCLLLKEEKRNVKALSAALATAKASERERCAKVCDERKAYFEDQLRRNSINGIVPASRSEGAASCAFLIRALKEEA